MVTKSLLNKDDSEAVNALKANDYESDEGTGGIDEVTRAVQNKVSFLSSHIKHMLMTARFVQMHSHSALAHSIRWVRHWIL